MNTTNSEVNNSPEDIKLPSGSTKYILWQRSKLQWKFSRYLTKWIPFGQKLYTNYLIPIESKIRKIDIKNEYFKQMKQEYEKIAPYLPDTCKNYIDIGCGIGGINLYIIERYLPDLNQIYLFDKNEISNDIYYQFHQTSSYYNSLDLARDTLLVNKVPNGIINTLPVEKTELTDIQNIDLCFSLYSWGFHYPIETYIKDVYEILTDDGILILDIRKDTDGLERCQRYFQKKEIIVDNQKNYRILFSKK